VCESKKEREREREREREKEGRWISFGSLFPFLKREKNKVAQGKNKGLL